VIVALNAGAGEGVVGCRNSRLESIKEKEKEQGVARGWLDALAFPGVGGAVWLGPLRRPY